MLHEHYTRFVQHPIVIRRGQTYAGLDSRFNALLEEAMWFPDYDQACVWLGATGHGPLTAFEIEYLAGAIAREDQEYAAQLQEMRG
jgi:hypothetical protein